MATFADFVAAGRSQPSLADVMQRAMQVREQRRQRKLEEERGVQRQKQLEELPGAIQEAEAGDLTKLWKIDPGMAMQFRTQQVKGQAAKEAGLEQRTKNFQDYMLNIVENRPTAAPALFQQAQALAERGVIKSIDVPDPAQAPTGEEMYLPGDLRMFAEKLKGRRAAMGVRREKPTSDIGKRVYELYRFEPGTREFQVKFDEVADTMGKAKLAAAMAESVPEMEDNLRQEFANRKNSKSAMVIANQFNKVMGASDNAAGDLNLIFGFMKLLDPDSVVREAEFQNAERVQSWRDWLTTSANNLISNEKNRLSQAAREMMKREAAKVFTAGTKLHRGLAQDFMNMGQARGANPDFIVTPTVQDVFRLGDKRYDPKEAASVIDLETPPPMAGPPPTDAERADIQKRVDIATMTDEELRKKYGLKD